MYICVCTRLHMYVGTCMPLNVCGAQRMMSGVTHAFHHVSNRASFHHTRLADAELLSVLPFLLHLPKGAGIVALCCCFCFSLDSVIYSGLHALVKQVLPTEPSPSLRSMLLCSWCYPLSRLLASDPHALVHGYSLSHLLALYAFFCLSEMLSSQWQFKSYFPCPRNTASILKLILFFFFLYTFLSASNILSGFSKSFRNFPVT